MLYSLTAAIEGKDLLGPAATLLVGAISAILIVRQLIFLRRRNEFDVLVELETKIRTRLPVPQGEAERNAAAFYGLNKRFAGIDGYGTAGGRRDYERSLLARVRALGALSPEEYKADLKLIGDAVNALNTIGEAVENRYVSRDVVLARYHLLFIRDAYLIEPYVVREVVLGTRGRWGMRVLALGEIARLYNDMNPIHRRAVYFTRAGEIDKDYGPIHLTPDLAPFKLAIWSLRRSVGIGYPTLTERRKRRQQKLLARLDDALRDQERV